MRPRGLVGGGGGGREGVYEAGFKPGVQAVGTGQRI